MDVTPLTADTLGKVYSAKNVTITNQMFQSVAEGLTAKAGGGQATATPISAMCTRFTVCATPADSSILPVATPGLELTVINAGAASMNVFPDVGSTINALSANTAFAVAAGKTAIFCSTVAGAWHAVLSA